MARATIFSIRLRRYALTVLAGLVSVPLWPAIAPASAVSQGDAKLIYGVGTTQIPATRTLSGDAWSVESSLPTASAAVRHIITKAAPTRDEFISGVITANNNLVIYRWNGNSWTEQWRVSFSGNNTTHGKVPQFDIAYEQVSGRAMVAYSTSLESANKISYRQWNGTSWTAVTAYNSSSTNTAAHTIRLEPRRNTNEIAMAWVNLGSSLLADYYDGTANTWRGTPSTILEANVAQTGTSKFSSKTLDLVFEDVSGRLLLIWGNDDATFPYYVIRSAGPSGTWGSKQSGSSIFQSQGMDIQLAAEPDSNYIAYTNLADYHASGVSQQAEAAIWNGSSWVHSNRYDTSATQLEPSLVRTSVKWIQSAGQSRAVIVYDDDNQTGVDWLYFNKNTLTWSAVQPDYTSAPTPGASGEGAGAMWLYNNPFNPAELTYVTIDGNKALFTKRLTFNGTTLTWSNLETTTLKTGLSYRSGWAVSFAYSQYAPAIGSLGIDIVTATGASITNPVIAFSSITSNANCQISTTSLGTSAQKIRISNTTTGSPWTMSITATAGPDATWSSGMATYDFNDSTGDGCTDGSDTDTAAGQLTINPANGSITPQAGCSVASVNKGSNTHFNQTTVDSITIASASSSAPINCYWDVADIAVSQTIPTLQPVGSYSLPMTITVTAL